MSDANLQLIEQFYDAFGERDGAAMSACYAPHAHFSDPVFTDLNGAEVGAMWRMLTGASTDLRVELLERDADGDSGTAHWRAYYTFSQSDRPVVNDVRATLQKIVDPEIHIDIINLGLMADFYDVALRDFGLLLAALTLARLAAAFEPARRAA